MIKVASFVICVSVIASFGIFALDETKGASTAQQQQLSNEAAGGEASAASAPASDNSSVHRAINEVSNAVTSPFSGVVSASSGEWTEHVVKLALALVLYGFGLGYLVRALRVH